MAQQNFTFTSQVQMGFDLAGVSPKDELLLAVSGGADSMALLHAAVELWANNKARLSVAHINHGLRGEASDADEALVRESANKLGCRFELLTLPPGRLEDQAKGSLEEAARNTRYEWLATTASRLDAKFIATAHHAEDQAETILHNICRGTGLRGLAGMQAVRALDNGVSLVRPMLNFERADIDEFLNHRGIKFRRDESNSDTRFTRNRIRTELLPMLKDSLNAQVVKNLQSLSSIADETANCMDQLAHKVLNQALLHSDERSCRLDTNAFKDWPPVVVRQCLIVMWTQLGWPRQKMSYRHWARLSELAVGKSSSAVQLPGNVRASRHDSLFRLTRRLDEPAS